MCLIYLIPKSREFMSLNRSLKAFPCWKGRDVYVESLGPQLKRGNLQMQNSFDLGYCLDIYSIICSIFYNIDMFILILKTITSYFFSIGSPEIVTLDISLVTMLSIGSLLSWQPTLLCKAVTPLDINRFLVTLVPGTSGCSSTVEDVT